MFELSPELQTKFVKFRDSYEWALVWLADAGGNAERKERDAWESARRDVPISEIEEEMFRRLLKEETSPQAPVPDPPRSTAIPRPDDFDTGDLPKSFNLPPIPKPEE